MPKLEISFKVTRYEGDITWSQSMDVDHAFDSVGEYIDAGTVLSVLEIMGLEIPTRFRRHLKVAHKIKGSNNG